MENVRESGGEKGLSTRRIEPTAVFFCFFFRTITNYNSVRRCNRTKKAKGKKINGE